MSEIQLVRMRRDMPATKNGPTTADVHPDEVEQYFFAGWEVDNSGPTFEEFIAAGYLPENYPPHGYEVKLSPGYEAYLTEKLRESDRAHAENQTTNEPTESVAASFVADVSAVQDELPREPEVSVTPAAPAAPKRSRSSRS